MREARMREFWDARAREDAFYFVDNRLRYREPDEERFWAAGRDVLDRMLPLLGVRIEPRDEIVEIGCGIGRITRELARRGATVRAIDVSSAMLDRARGLNEELANVTWILGDGETLAGIETASVDVSFSYVVFQHLPDPEMTLGYVREIGRVLRPGGWAAFQVSDLPRVHRRPPLARRILVAAAAALGRHPRGQTDPAWLGSAVDLGRLRQAGDEVGLKTARIVGARTQHCFVLMRAHR